ncbi:hypothetical protein [Streptomyces sp. NPDC002790]|uniref:hypothetical protein n=1 Tax=Streptomyces sp. NPDC002790 TaxID=3154431 RepID=UPI00332EDAAA
MRSASAGTAPAVVHRGRFARLLTVLAAVLLPLFLAAPASADPRPDAAAVLSVDAVAAPDATPAANVTPTVDGPSAVERYPAFGPHADDGITPCVAQQRARPDHPAGRPFALDHQGAPTGCGPGTATGAFTRDTAGPGTAPASPGRTGHDNNRAPPASCGI